MIQLELSRAALVLIDLQQGILASPKEPHTVEQVLENSRKLIVAFSSADRPIFLVHVTWSEDMGDRPPATGDQSFLPDKAPPPEFAEFSNSLGDISKTIPILKRQWGAFYGTPLDLQLRRRGVDTIVIGGIATNFGVESTARDAWERNYNVIFVEDAMSSMKASMHEFAVQNIFPRIGKVRSTEDVLDTLTKGALER